MLTHVGTHTLGHRFSPATQYTSRLSWGLRNHLRNSANPIHRKSPVMCKRVWMPANLQLYDICVWEREGGMGRRKDENNWLIDRSISGLKLKQNCRISKSKFSGLLRENGLVGKEWGGKLDLARRPEIRRRTGYNWMHGNATPSNPWAHH